MGKLTIFSFFGKISLFLLFIQGYSTIEDSFKGTASFRPAAAVSGRFCLSKQICPRKAVIFFMRIAFYTLGCKVNQYETQILEQLFVQRGYTLAPPDGEAEVYLVNSCTVTASGDQKTRQMLRRFKRRSPQAVTVLTGCYPQAFPEQAARLEEADLVTGTSERSRIPELVEQFLATGERIVAVKAHRPREGFESMRADGFLERTRAFVKIEDGCDRYCAYCIIPTARGPVRSKPLEALVEEVDALAKKGYREVVLSGINLSSYGRELGLRLVDAVLAVCRRTGVERVRLGSLEPELLTREDIQQLAGEKKFCPQFHLSLQSGCDATLKRMNRRYTSAEYMEIVDNIRKSFANPSVTTDIMVGFPGETEEEFSQSLEFARAVGFAKVHVFAYSRRPGTKAADMPDQLPNRIKEERSARMIQLCEEGRDRFLRSQAGRVEQVLFESVLPDGSWEGYTFNYTPVRVRSDEKLQGCCRAVRLAAEQDGKEEFCRGELLPNRLSL